MNAPVRVEARDRLDGGALAAVRDLVERVTATAGRRPLGEHKQRQLDAGPDGFGGVLARDPGGALVGYAHLHWDPPGGLARLAIECAVAPGAGEGVQGALLDAAADRLARAGGGRLWLWAHHVRDPDATLAARRGWRVQRDLAFMRRPLGERPVPDLPAGVTLRAYRGAGDDREFLRVNNAAFAGHPENGGWDRAEFAARRRQEWFDPEGLLLAWRDGRLVGFHWTKVHPPSPGAVGGAQPTGEVYVLAVDPEAHGRGLGRGLLEAGLAHLYDRGCRMAVLYVDRASIPAFRLYERAGFTVAHHEVCYERTVAAAGAAG